MYKGYVGPACDHDPVLTVPQYLDEFSKALATEVRILLGEVGKLREERRNLQQYVLLFLKQKGPS